MRMKRKREQEQVPSERTYEEIQLGYYRNFAFEADSEDEVDCSKITDQQLNSSCQPSTSSTRSINELRSLPASQSIRTNDCHHTFNSIAAINLKNVYFRYNNKQEWIHSCLQMQVPHACMYTLIGATGSGKTSLIKLIIGLLKPVSGCIQVLNHQTIGEMSNDFTSSSSIENDLPRLSIGFMPSELALYEEMTISEQLTYFGRLYLMSNDEIELRIKQLTCQLKFQCIDQPIWRLSKDEKHCASLACAIVHNPSLLICDEPLTSLCPEIKQIICTHLTDLVKHHHTTILLTSSHFDDTRKFSNLVAFLRKGKLSAEKSPDVLLTNYRLNSLEQVYIKLCKLEKIKAKSTMDPVFLQIKQAVDNRIEELNSPEIPSSQVNHLKRIYLNNSSVNRQLENIRPKFVWLLMFAILLHTNFRRLFKRFPSFAIFQLLVPIYQLLLFYLAVGRNPFNLSIGIVNEDHKMTLSRKFVESIDNYFINQIDYKNFNDAILDLKRGRLTSVMHIGPQFSDLIYDRFNLNDNLTKKNIESSNIFLHSDLTNKFLTKIIERSLINSFQLFTKQLSIANTGNMSTITNRTLKSNLIHFPIQFERPIYGKTTSHPEHKTWRNFTISGLLLNISFAMSFYFTCTYFIEERKCSMLEKQYMTKCSSTQLIFTYTIFQLIISLLQTILILILSVELFDLTISNSYLPILSLSLLVNTIAILMGVLCSSFFKRTYTVLLVSFASFINQLIIGGCLWPIQSYPHSIRYLSILLNPTTLPSQTLENLLFRSSSSCLTTYLYCIIWICLLMFSMKSFKFINL